MTPNWLHISPSTYVHICTLFVSYAVFIYYFNCISFAIRLSGRKVAIKLIDWLKRADRQRKGVSSSIVRMLCWLWDLVDHLAEQWGWYTDDDDGDEGGILVVVIWMELKTSQEFQFSPPLPSPLSSLWVYSYNPETRTGHFYRRLQNSTQQNYHRIRIRTMVC